MLFNSSDAPLLVVVSIVCINQPDYKNVAEESVTEINKNLPQCCLNINHVRSICAYLYNNMREWTNFVMELDLEDDRSILLKDFLHNGLLAYYTLPPDEITTEGLQRTMTKIFDHAQEHEVSYGTLEPPTFDYTEESD